MHRSILAIFVVLLSYAIRGGDVCSQIIDVDTIYLALSSEERNYYRHDDENFKDSQATLIERRAREICAHKGCGILKSYNTEELNMPFITAFIPHRNEIEQDSFMMVRPCKYADDGHKKLGNFLWYLGHTLTCFTIVGALSYWPVFDGVTTLIPPFFVVLSQAITMASRPIERSEPQEINVNEALERIAQKKKVNKLPVSGKKVPHLRFSSLICEPSPPPFESEIIM